jgi:hypothetical protein
MAAIADTVGLPRSLAEVSAAWFSAALSQRYPGTEVATLDRDTVIKGMATKARYLLSYSAGGDEHGLPRSMWLKSGFEAHSARSAQLYAAEVSFFHDIAPVAGINTPVTYFEAIDPATGNGVLLMEDLTERGVTFGTQTQPITPDVAASLLAIQARYHSFLLRRPGGPALDWLSVGGAIHSVDVAGEYLHFWPTASAQPRWVHVPPVLDNPDRIRAGLQTMLSMDRNEGRWLVHGDPHLGNLFFDAAGTGGFLDWQTVMRSSWAFDLAYFLIMSLSVADRRANERDLIREYLARLRAEHGLPPVFRDAWTAYRQHAMWSFLTVLCPVNRQSEEICQAHAERACAALVDLETLQSLGA